MDRNNQETLAEDGEQIKDKHTWGSEAVTTFIVFTLSLAYQKQYIRGWRDDSSVGKGLAA